MNASELSTKASQYLARGARWSRAHAGDISIFLFVCAIAAVWGAFLFSQFEFQRLCRGFDLWFDSDPARTVANITSRWVTFHERSFYHPLYSILIAGPFGAIEDIFGLRTSTTTLLYAAVQSAAVSGVLYAAARVAGFARIDAILLPLLVNSTSAAIYWIGFPEWVAFGAASAFLPVLWIAAPARFQNRLTGCIQSALAAGITLTNWAVGGMASFFSAWPKLRWAQAFSHTRDALALMAVLAFVQYGLFPHSGGFLNFWAESRLFLDPESPDHGLLPLFVEFWGQTLVAPNVLMLQEGPRTVPGWAYLIMTGQSQGVQLTPLTVLIFALWLGLFVYGVRAALKGAVKPPVMVLVLGSVLFYFVLHLFLGGEIFLFSLQVAPFLAFIVLCGAQTKHRNIVRALCVGLTLASFSYNYPAFQAAVAQHNAIDESWLTREGHRAQVEVWQTDCN